MEVCRHQLDSKYNIDTFIKKISKTQIQEVMHVVLVEEQKYRREVGYTCGDSAALVGGYYGGKLFFFR
jgi:hypothetical protein